LKGQVGEIKLDWLKFRIYHGIAKEVKEQLSIVKSIISLFADISQKKNHQNPQIEIWG
jgi:hypothetical protein